jgi:hypothetical protein
MAMHDFLVRSFRDGDEQAIIELFNNVYGRYGGFVPRTAEYWRWCCLERPDVERDGIFLVFGCGRLCGYLVAGSSGNIWEFCVADNDREAAGVLLGEAVSYLDRVGVCSVNINVPSDTAIVEVLREAGFGEVDPVDAMFVTTLNPAALVREMVTPQEKVLVKRFDDEFGIRLRDVPYGVATEFSVKIRNSSVGVVEGFPVEPSIVVELRFVDLLSVLFGGSNAGQLFLTGKMRVRPFWKLRKVLTLLSAIGLKSSWFFPLSDLV